MVELNLGWLLASGLLLLTLHLISVTFSRALRSYSRSRLEEVCAAHGHAPRADAIAHYDERTERSAEALAVATGLLLAALLGAVAERVAPRQAIGAVVAGALAIGGLGYVLAGIIGRVFAEPVIDALWPAARPLRILTTPLTWGTRQVEGLVERLARPADGTPRPASVEVEIPSDGDDRKENEVELPESTRELLIRAVEWARRDVSEIMTPRKEIVSLPLTVSAPDAARTFRATGKSRIPLFGASRDDIVGILYAKDLFPRMTDQGGDSVTPSQFARPVFCVPETKNAHELLDELRERRTQIAIVLDEFGGVSGLITLEDLLEKLVGDIDDEHDEPASAESIRLLGGSVYEVDATLALEELNDRLRLHLPTDADFLTVGGFAFHELGRVPEPGETFRHDGIEYTIVAVADHSILTVRINLQPAVSTAVRR